MSTNDVLAWVGAIGGGLGGISGAGALIYAAIAKCSSDKSSEVARSSEQSAKEAVVLARDANRIAVDAKQLAEEANTISLRGEARETERHDVTWELNRIRPGTYQLVNTGNDEAHRVSATIYVDEWRATTSAETVPAGDGLTVTIPEAERQFQREKIEVQRARRRDRIEGGLPSAWNREIQMGFHSIGYRVTWETPLGRQLVEHPDQTRDALGDFDAD